MSREMKHSGIEWIGEIPKEWKVAKLKQLGSYINGYAFKPEDWSDSGKPIIRIQDLTGSFSNPNYFSGTIDNRYLITKGDILVSWAATLDAFIWSNEDGWLNQHIFKAVPDSCMNSRFFYWLIKVAMDNMNNDNKHGIVMQHVTVGLFGNFLVGVPSYSEQQKIANYLDKVCGEVDEMIALQEQMIEELKAYKQSVITEAVTKGLNPNVPMKDSGIDWIGEVPEHWEVCRFKDVASVKANLVHPDDYLDYPQIAPDNIEKGSGRLLPYKSVKESNVISDNHLFFKGQIIYSKIRPVLNKLIIAPFDGLCSADMYPIETKNDTNYQKYYMLSEVFVSQVALVVQDRVKMPKINKEELSVIYFLSLPLDEQQSIASYLDTKCSEIDALITIKQQKIEDLKDYKKSVIYEYVTGKKEVV